jgi:dipeptidyl aminopeptidase/acylaminoacyl peptidase
MPAYRDFQPNLRLQATLALSPDGRQVAYVDDSNGQFNVVIKPVTGGPARRLTSYLDSAVRRVAWHPDGQSLLFLADAKGDENAQIFLLDLAADHVEALTDAPDAQHAAALGEPFSRDGMFLAYSANDRLPVEQDILIRDMATGEVRRVPANGRRLSAGHWSPDGTRLSVVDTRANNDHVVYVVSADAKSITRVTPEGADPAAYRIGPWLADGSGLLVLSNAGREFTGLGVLDTTTGAVSWLDTPSWNVEAAALSADGSVLVWIVNVDGSTELRARDLSSGQDLAVPALPMGMVSELAVSADGRRVALRMSTPTRPWNIATIDLAEGELRWLTQAAPTGADPHTFVEPDLVRYPAGDGHTVPAYLYRPTVAHGRRVGVLLSVHGGPEWQERPVYIGDGFYQYLLSHGIGVLAPNVRGSTGYGRAYQEVIYRDWGGCDLRDLADAVRYLRSLDWVHPQRIAVFGGSYGGFCALSCLSRLPELNWAAGVDVCGPSNLVTLAKSSPPTWHSLVRAMFGDPDSNADQLLARSPVTYADQIKAPLMVIQGANDPRVPQNESDQIVARLRARGVEVRYEVFPDEGHGFTKRENQAKAYTDIGDFLVEHLAG